MLKSFIAYLIITCIGINSTTFTVAPSSKSINALTDYSWNIDFSPVASRATITLTFSNNITLTLETTVVYNSVSLTITANTTNSVTFVATSLASVASATIIVTYIRNPPMAITSNFNFTLSSPFETNLQLANHQAITYTNAQLSSCIWQFSLCTQQPNSQLTITIVTQSPISLGNNQLIVGYEAVWANHISKNLMFQVTTFACAISLDDGATYFSSSVTCINNLVSNKITVNFQLSSSLLMPSTIKLQLTGVQTPPTSTTPLNNNNFVATADSNGYFIDKLVGCTINPVCITNITNGVLTTSPITVNQILTTQQIDFNSYPIITVLPSDMVSIQYSPQTNLVGCSVLKFWRTITTLQVLTVLNTANYSFIFPSDNFQIIDTSSPLYIYLACTAFIMPASQTPTPISFHFYRANSQYLTLTANIVASPGAFPLFSASLVLSNTQMAHANTNYVFDFEISQTLSTTSAIKIGFPSDIDISIATCSLTINGSPPTVVTCSNTTNILSIKISTATNILPNSRFQLTLSNVVNPLLPQLYTFSFSSYYNSSVASSVVESASPAFNATYTTITTLIPTLTPNAFTVYTTKQVNVTLKTPIPLPANSNFTLTFPPQITQLTSTSQPLLVNGFQIPISSLSINQITNTITFIKPSATLVDTTFIIMTTFCSPPALGTYNYVNLAITNSLVYIQCLNQLTLDVNIPSTMPVTIIANDPVTAQPSAYSITVTYTVPHPATFDLQIDIPSDTSYITTVGSCTPSCLVKTFNADGSQVIITISNPNPNSATIFSATYVLSSFNNRRFVGSGSSFKFTTISSSKIITQQSALLTINAPNLLIGQLDPSVFYTRDNAAPVDLYLNLSVNLLAGDYFLLTMDRTTYNSSSVLCSLQYGQCTIDPLSTANVLIINIIPNISTYSINPLQFKLQNLVSGHNTYYLQTDYITVNHLCSSGLIQTGKVTYQISCNSALAFPNQCKTCYNNGSCIDCYSSAGYYLNNNICVTSCGDATKFLRYADSTSSTCSPCINNCLTCINATACSSCLNSSFYLFTDSLTCQQSCPLFLGYVAQSVGSQLFCMACSDPFCLHCTVVAFGSCTLCNNISTLNNGICLSSCPSISYYVLNSVCVACDVSCYSCFGAGSMSCLRCAAGYANNTGVCSNSCPLGTAFIANLATCGCDTQCLTCSSLNYINCTACMNASLFVYQGQCITSCPLGSYKSGMNCLICPSGCAVCTGVSCSSCESNWYIFNSSCYSNCNLIAPQYDASGNTCILCPEGCDTCSGSTCNTCIQEYTLSGSTCIKSCTLTSSCPVDTSKIVPLPACIAVFVWGMVLLLLRIVSTKNYAPYSLLTVSSVIQYIELLICLLLLTQITSARLLLAVSQSSTVIKLLLTSLILNYIFNIVYIIVFLKYVKPLILKPKQCDNVIHFLVILFGTLTNFRFGLLAYSKLCSKPAVYIDNSSRLTPVHYLCVTSSIFDLLAVIGCGLCLYSQQKWTPLFMLSLDLLIILIFNAIVTIWFVASSKPEEYYEDKVKYDVDENATHENISNNEKDNSKINIVAIEDLDDHYAARMQEVQNIELGNQQYKSVRVTKTKVSPRKEASIHNKQLTQNPKNNKNSLNLEEAQPSTQLKQDKPLEIIGIEETQEQPEENSNSKDLFAKQLEDLDYQDSVPQKKFKEIYGNSKITSMRATPKPSQRYVDSRISNQAFKLDKQLQQSIEQKPETVANNIFQQAVQQEESDFPQLDEVSVKPKKTEISDSTQKDQSFNIHKSQYIRPAKRIKFQKQREKNNVSSILPRGVNPNDPKKHKESSKIVQIGGAQQEDVAQEKELNEDDFQSIIRQKVFESKIRKKYEVNLFDEEGELEDISPSKFNAANQRFRQNEHS